MTLNNNWHHLQHKAPGITTAITDVSIQSNNIFSQLPNLNKALQTVLQGLTFIYSQ